MEEAQRMPDLRRFQLKIDSEMAISPAATVTEAKGRADLHLNRVYSRDDSTARMMLAALHQKRLLPVKRI